MCVNEILRQKIRVGKECDSFDVTKQMMIVFRMELCPVLNDNNEIIEIYFWEDLFEDKKPKIMKEFNLPVIIMAGGSEQDLDH